MKNKNNSVPLIGAHMSIAKGFDEALREAKKIGCSCIQFFTHSNRQWNIKPLTPDSISRFEHARETVKIDSIVVHASYLINLASPHVIVRKNSLITLKQELEHCHQLGIDKLVLHPGSAGNLAVADAQNHLVTALNIILNEKKEYSTKIVLETMAGQGSSLGRNFEQLAAIIQRIDDQERIGVCFDTCHVFASGYDLRTKKTYEATWKLFDDFIGIKKVEVIHVNDSKKSIGSFVDRHEHIGKGEIGEEAFVLLMNDARFTRIPKILETPKDEPTSDVINIDLLKSFIH